MNLRRLIGLGALLLVLGATALASRGGAALAVAPIAAPTTAALTGEELGQAIYTAGVLGSGAPLVGVRKEGQQNLEGASAACVKCHLHSGLGSQEGGYAIPPISAPYLFHAADIRTAGDNLPFVPGQRLDHPPYTEETLGRAIREGVDSTGKSMGYLMPRYALSDSELAGLIAYLKALAPEHVPGVTATVLHFATIITPDADPVKKKGMLDVLQAYFAEKNTFPFGPSPHMQASGKAGGAKSMYMANRHWQLHVWQLNGPADSWRAQLDRYLREEPVMAVISGLGGTNWAPVHAFCEHSRLPCLFPNAEVPVVADQDFYSLYFSKGVLLEAQLVARRILDQSVKSEAGLVQQVYRTGDSGEAAARALAAALEEGGAKVQDVKLPANASAGDVRTAVQAAGAKGPMALWLRADDLKALGDLPVPSSSVYVSGLMGGLEHAPLPVAWRKDVWMAYPFDLPDRRVVRVDYPMGWFRIRNIPVVAQQVQVDTYLACGLLSENLNHMADNFGREYLVERMEQMLGHRIITGYYPRLSLAEGQRFASKGGYLVQFAPSGEGKVVADGGWTVP